MAIDSIESHRKHHRSPSADESPEKSKRSKHRHHRHHRHRHHRHRSKRDEAKKDEIESEVGIVDKSGDYDMEEGEIVEEGDVFVAKAGIDDTIAASDLESGELNDCDMRGVDAMENSAMDYDTKSSKILKSPSDRSDDSKNRRSQASIDESPESASIANGDSSKISSKGGRSRGRSKSPLKSSDKRKDKHESESKDKIVKLMEEDEDEHGGRRNSHSRKTRDDSPPSNGRYHVETGDRSRPESVERLTERQRSQSIVHEKHTRSRHHRERDEGTYENGKVYDDIDEEREKASNKRRERSSSRHRSSMHGNSDSLDIKRDEMIYRDKRISEQEPVRARRDREWENERDRRGRDRERESDKEKAREAKRGGDWDRECDRDWENNREKDRGRSRDRDYDRDRRRDASTSSFRDRNLERGKNKDLETGRARYSYRGRNRHDGSDRSRRYDKYEDQVNGHGDRDRHHGYNDTEYTKDRNRKYESEKDRPSKGDSIMENEDPKRDDDDQNGYQESVELILAEQEEDDVGRIKEESRRRREAILQKYKAKQLQQQDVTQDSKAESDEKLNEQPPQKAASANTVQGESDDKLFDVGKSPLGNENTAVETSTGAAGLGAGSPKSERSNDMFSDDIFGDYPAGIRKTGKGDGLPIERSGLHDNWDDPEGYYSFRFGEILDSRYEVTAAHGKGVFSTVVRAKDLKAGNDDPEEVAIKIIRNNETMLKAGTEEMVILKKLVGADPEDRRHCVRYLSHFKYRNHLCIVFESLHMNLREVLKKFGRNIGLKLTAVRTYAKQLFIALKHLRNCGVLHSDIKPDNMLVNEAKNVLKLCDFGNAMFAGKNEITPGETHGDQATLS